jgi:hypothetical protein
MMLHVQQQLVRDLREMKEGNGDHLSLVTGAQKVAAPLSPFEPSSVSPRPAHTDPSIKSRLW